MTEDEEIAFTEKYRARYEAAYARHGSALKTPKPAFFPASIKDKNVFLGGALPVPLPLKMPTVYSKQPTLTERLPTLTSADWHPVNDTGPQVTPEMLTAAKESMLDYGWMSPGDKALTIAYRAMRELESSTTLTLAPDARMVEERDKATRELHQARCWAGAISEHYSSLLLSIDISGALIPTFEPDGLNMKWTDRERIMRLIENRAVKDQRVRDEIATLAAEKDAALAKFEGYKTAMRQGCAHPPPPDDECHLIWWPDSMPLSVLCPDGLTAETSTLINTLVEERDAAKGLVNDGLTAMRMMKDEIAALTAEKNHLHDQLAKFTAVNVAETEPARPNPFRDFPTDPRRMGR